MKVTLDLTKDEYCGLKAIATRCDVPLRDILVQFVADLTGSDRTGGSDERDMAEAYVKRCNYAGALWGSDTYMPEEQRQRYRQQADGAMRWYDAAEWFRRANR